MFWFGRPKNFLWKIQSLKTNKLYLCPKNIFYTVSILISRKNLVEKKIFTINSWKFDGIIVFYIIDGVEGLDYCSRDFKMFCKFSVISLEFQKFFLVTNFSSKTVESACWIWKTITIIWVLVLCIWFQLIQWKRHRTSFSYRRSE